MKYLELKGQFKDFVLFSLKDIKKRGRWVRMRGS
jgi:hypothetical protein